MHAHEILEFLRSKLVKPLGVSTPNHMGSSTLIGAEFDRGSVEDQLWEESAFMQDPKDPDAFSTIRDLHEGWYGVEVVRFESGSITLEKFKVLIQRDDQWNWSKAEVEMVLQKRKDLGL